jgi:hypothetical protein
MGITDYGGLNDPLSNPPLGGPQGWSRAVADELQRLAALPRVDQVVHTPTFAPAGLRNRPNWDAVKAVRTGKDVTITGWLENTAATEIAAKTTLFTLPLGFEPDGNQCVAIAFKDGTPSTPIFMQIKADRTVCTDSFPIPANNGLLMLYMVYRAR